LIFVALATGASVIFIYPVIVAIGSFGCAVVLLVIAIVLILIQAILNDKIKDAKEEFRVAEEKYRDLKDRSFKFLQT
jgi:hypothetical protein